ncbi:MAG: hypothetical protein EPN39_17780 [Chitinophagaceae bacterium]|nr:MAG: hypothetical protein EPN39_17780 [Chitinophagaceae bacterium]
MSKGLLWINKGSKPCLTATIHRKNIHHKAIRRFLEMKAKLHIKLTKLKLFSVTIWFSFALLQRIKGKKSFKNTSHQSLMAVVERMGVVPLYQQGEFFWF